MAANSASFHNTAGEADQSFPVKKPSSNSSREIRDTILKDYFGYTDADIAEVVKTQDTMFYVVSDNETFWATIDKVRGWKTNAAGEISVPIPQKVIENIIAFREARASFQVFAAALKITDAETRKYFAEDVEAILSSTADKRAGALRSLMVAIAGSSNSRGEIYYALRTLINEAGYKNNPFLLIAFAATTSYKSDSPSIGSGAVNQTAIANAVKAVNDNLYNSSAKLFVPKINRSEAAQINLMASVLYDNLNFRDEATNRRWIDRFFGMSEAERKSLKEGDSISIAPSGVDSMRGPFVSEIDLQNIKQKHAESVETWKQNDQIGKDQSFRVPSDGRRSTLYQDKVNDVYPTKTKIVPANDAAHSLEIAPDGFKSVYSNGKMNYVTAPVSLILEYGKWSNVNERMKVITEYLNKKQILEARIRLDNYHLIPPPPEVIEKYIKDLRRDGRITVNPFEKTKIVGVLSQLNGLLEESYAFYKSTK